MFLGYNTNGLAHHDPLDAIDLLAELGYGGIGLTIDHGLLSPHDDPSVQQRQLDELAYRLAKNNMRCVIETGARFLLDPRKKHEPTFVSPTEALRKKRIEFLCYAIEVATKLQADCVSFWSGIVHDDTNETETLSRLVSGLSEVISFAAENNMPLAFEPEPGMFIDTMASFDRLKERLEYTIGKEADLLDLTIDVGHLHCLGELPLGEQLRKYSSQLKNIHIEDMKAGVHEHLMFGEGEIDFAEVMTALHEIGYDAGVYVELSRHSHQGPTAARQAAEFLGKYL